MRKRKPIPYKETPYEEVINICHEADNHNNKGLISFTLADIVKNAIGYVVSVGDPNNKKLLLEALEDYKNRDKEGK